MDLYNETMNKYAVYVNVDENGNIKNSLMGLNIIPDKQYDYYFLVNEDIALNIDKYKVILDGNKPKLSLKID